MSVEKRKEPSTLVDHEEALKVYIDALLLEPGLEEPVEPEEAAEIKLLDGAAVDLPLNNISSESVAVEEADAGISDQLEKQQYSHEDSNDIIECLMFKVAGSLTLAVPLECLNGILKWNGEITPIPGHAEWFLGLISNRGRQIKVIDVARFVIPENHKMRLAVEGERNFKHLLLIDNGKLALACDDLGKVLKVTGDKIRWRQDRSSRPWLAGTIIEQMSALIDVERFIEMLKKDVPLDVIS